MKKYDKLFLTLGICLCLTEILKQFLLTFYVNGGTYDWWYFPFQLCSLPMYLLPALPFIRAVRVRHAVLSFLMTYNLLGGIAVFFDTSGMRYPIAILTIHSYLWHLALILIGLLSGYVLLQEQIPVIKKNARLPRQTFLHSTFLYVFFCFIAEAVNLIPDSIKSINMFYINPDFPMDQVFFRDIAAALGNGAGIFAYLLFTVIGSRLLFSLWNVAGRLLASRCTSP